MKQENRAEELRFRDPVRARALTGALSRIAEQLNRPLMLMHVCGSHEQAIARFGLRAVLPASLQIIMGPGCPVCVTATEEIDQAITLAKQGLVITTYGDMLRVPGSALSLADAKSAGARVQVVYGIDQAVHLAQQTHEEVVFFASGFETTAVTTAAAVLAGIPRNLSILSAHKLIPPAMDVIATFPDSRIEGFLAAGHAATITGYGIFEPFAARYKTPVVVAGFEPLDILAALVRLAQLVRDQHHVVDNMYPRCVTREGNRNALAALWQVFEAAPGHWRGVANVATGNLRLRTQWAHVDASKRYAIANTHPADAALALLSAQCACGAILTGRARPTDCLLFGKQCLPEAPVGACMVSSEGACRIWHQYGGHPLAAEQ